MVKGDESSVRKKGSFEKKLEKQKRESEDDNPSWYHYVIVSVVIFGFFFGVFWLLGSFDEKGGNVLVKTYPYELSVGNVTYRILLNSPESEVRALEYNFEIDKYDLLNTVDFTLVYHEYNGTDNGKVTVASSKLVSFLKKVFFFSFDEDSFKRDVEYNCSNSTMMSRVIIFEVGGNRTGVFEDRNTGCLSFEVENATQMMGLVDLFMLRMTD